MCQGAMQTSRRETANQAEYVCVSSGSLSVCQWFCGGMWAACCAAILCLCALMSVVLSILGMMFVFLILRVVDMAGPELADRLTFRRVAPLDLLPGLDRVAVGASDCVCYV